MGDLVFTTLDSGQISEEDGITFKQFAEQRYPIFLERQLLAKGMKNRRPEILFMEPVEVSTLQNKNIRLMRWTTVLEHWHTVNRGMRYG